MGRHPLVREVCAMLNEVDPYGLQPGLPGGFPVDEYESEASTLAGVLVRKGSIAPRDVDEVWERWFGESLTGLIGYAAVAALAARMNALRR